MIHSANLGLRFLLEICALSALGYWGWCTGGTALTRLGLTAGTVVAVATVWGLFVAPKASVTVPSAVRVLLQVLVFGAAAAALYVVHRPMIAAVFTGAVVVNATFIAAWRQQA